MSSRFLTSEQQHSYGRYVSEPTSVQLAHYFHLDDTAKQLVQKRRGDYNLLGGEKARLTPLEQLRKSPTRSSAPALVNALNRLVIIRTLGISKLNMGKIPPIRFKALSKTAFTLRAQAIARMPTARRIATLVAWAYVMEAIALDDALDVLDLLVKDILAKSERDGKKKRLRTLKDLDTAALQLATACQVIVNPSTDDAVVREEIWQLLTLEQLTSAIAKVEELARPPEDNYYQELFQQWRAVRRFLPKFLSTIDFEGNLAGQKILEAWQFLQSIEGLRKPKMDAAPLKIVDKRWASWVIQEDGGIDRRAYTFCVLEQLLEGLRRRDLFVSQGDRWSNPRAKLLQGKAWESARSSVCRTLNLNPKPEPELKVLQKQLDQAYSQTAENLPQNSEVRIEVDKSGFWVILALGLSIFASFSRCRVCSFLET